MQRGEAGGKTRQQKAAILYCRRTKCLENHIPFFYRVRKIGYIVLTKLTSHTKLIVMKKLLVFLMSFGLLIACNNNKGPLSRDDKNTTNRDKDDYRDGDKTDKDKDDGNSKYTNDKDENDKNNNSDASWTSSETRKFVNDCVDAAVKGGMQQSTAESYCNCMQKKLEKIYPDFKDTDKMDAESSSIKSMAKNCLGMDDNNDNSGSDNSGSDNSGGWTKSDENSWLNQCVGPLTEKLGENDAKRYCNCMLETLEDKYKDYKELDKYGTYDEGVSIGRKCMKKLGLQ
jgi:hypothetical protein